MLNAWNIGYACCGTTALPKHLSLSTRSGSPLTTLPTPGSAAQQRPSASSCDSHRPCCPDCPLHMAWCITSPVLLPASGCTCPVLSVSTVGRIAACPCTRLPSAWETASRMLPVPYLLSRCCPVHCCSHLLLALAQDRSPPLSHPRMPSASAGLPAPSNCWAGAGSSCRRSLPVSSLPRSCGSLYRPSCWA